MKCTFKTIKYWFIYKEKLEEGGVRGKSKSQEGKGLFNGNTKFRFYSEIIKQYVSNQKN